jgi:allantoinase
LVAEARAEGVDVTCETCPHYLFLTDDDMIEHGAVAKCAPPLRSLDDQRELWTRLAEVDTLGSDHSPSPPEMKQRDNFFDVWGGISGCQHVLALLSGRVSSSEIARLTSEGVAQRFRLAGKGGFGIGKDADLTLVDHNAQEIVTTESLHYRHRQSPYVGRTMSGRIVRTLLRGQTVYANGNFASRPLGRFVRPEQS